MSIKKNTAANYCGRIYTALIGIIILPLYLQYLGPASFGLISLFTVMYNWLSLLDIGLIPTLSREIAYHRNTKKDNSDIKQLLRSLEIIFFIISIVISLSILFSSPWIAHHWLKIENLDYSKVTNCIVIIGAMISLRWLSDLYRGGILGLECQVWLNGANIILATLQYVGGYLLLRWITHDPLYFFKYQLVIAAIEPFILGIKFYKILPDSLNPFLCFKISWKSVKKVFPFAISIAYTSTIWVSLTQLDKVLLSHILPLSTYGYFSLVTMISGGIFQFSAPISQAIIPRMTFLLSQGKKQEMLDVYRNATQIISVIILTLTGIIAIFGTEIVYAWTGNRAAANWAGPILFWYAIGNGFLSIAAFQFYLQFAYGNLKLHVIFNTIFAVMAIPLIIYSAYHYGAMGTAITWCLMESIAFIIWTPVIHYKFAPGIHRQWLLKDILPILIVVAAMLLFIKNIPIDFLLMNRYESFIFFIGITILVWLASALASSTCRDYLIIFIRNEGKIKV